MGFDEMRDWPYFVLGFSGFCISDGTRVFPVFEQGFRISRLYFAGFRVFNVMRVPSFSNNSALIKPVEKGRKRSDPQNGTHTPM